MHVEQWAIFFENLFLLDRNFHNCALQVAKAQFWNSGPLWLLNGYNYSNNVKLLVKIVKALFKQLSVSKKMAHWYYDAPAMWPRIVGIQQC